MRFILTAPAMEAPAYFCIRQATGQSGSGAGGLGGEHEVSQEISRSCGGEHEVSQGLAEVCEVSTRLARKLAEV